MLFVVRILTWALWNNNICKYILIASLQCMFQRRTFFRVWTYHSRWAVNIFFFLINIIIIIFLLLRRRHCLSSLIPRKDPVTGFQNGSVGQASLFKSILWVVRTVLFVCLFASRFPSPLLVAPWWSESIFWTEFPENRSPEKRLERPQTTAAGKRLN